MPRHTKQETFDRADAVEALLKASAKPMAYEAMTAHFGVVRTTLRRALSLLKAERRIHVADHCRSRPGGPWVALYAAGDLPDVPMPRKSPEQAYEEQLVRSREQVRRKRERRAAETAATQHQPAHKVAMDPLVALLFNRAPPPIC